MPTLYQILKEKLAGKPAPKLPVPEFQIYNPITAKRGLCVTIDDIDCKGKNFFIKSMRESTVNIGGKEFKFTDYVLEANSLSGESVTIRLRVCPEPNGKFGLPFRAMVLRLYDSLEYNEGLHNVVRDTAKKFVVDDKDLHEEYWRVNDVGTSYTAAMAVAEEGKADLGKLPNVEFWDYSRMTKVDGVETEQFLFVEMNTDNGWFELWRGYEINPEQVMVL